MFKEPKNDEDVIDFLRGIMQKPSEPKEDQWLRDNYPRLFLPKK